MQMSTTPKGPCQSGYYCPNTSAIIPCPPGQFCKWWTKEPKVQRPSTKPHNSRLWQPVSASSCPHWLPRGVPHPLCCEGAIPPETSQRPQSAGNALQDCPWMAKCPAGSASADISLGGFFALFLILALLWLAYVAFSAYIKCALELDICF